ncbi:MAG: peptidoglycan editing factor PgeF [Rhodospirillales bacterium]|nr:peptidoglycan editing factor PgeF [Rhodospirillales bacterium]MSP79947.1 peptidoglycan editing factor PgeF [Rhodospirillales bacterium]
MINAQELARAAGVRHGFFTRQGGVSEGVYASLNCGFGSNDNPAHVAENRAIASRALGLSPEALVTVYQVHSAEVVVADEPWPPARAPKADGIVTRRPGIALGVLTADCAPVLLADAGAGVIGAAHAGWRGALGGILEATARAMERLGARLSATVAVVGPCIHQSSYEVGADLRDAVLAADGACGDLFRAGARSGKYQFDLPGFIVRRLQRLALGAVARVAGDTFADEKRFYSYRRSVKRGEADYGRKLSAIALVG